MNDAFSAETQCNPEVVYEPPTGWWCRDCGAFTEVDDDDLCVYCRRRVLDTPSAETTSRRPRGIRRAHRN